MQNRIRILRTNNKENIQNPESIKLVDGQPFYDKSTKYLYIASTDDTAANVHSIVAEHANIENLDNQDNANVNFSIGDFSYNKTVNNVSNVTTSVGSDASPAESVFTKQLNVTNDASIRIGNWVISASTGSELIFNYVD